MPKRLLQTISTFTVNKDRISRKNVRDKEHIVISGVGHMIGDAVMNRIHYPMSETKLLANSLGNKRVVMPSSHPTGDNGEFISASDPLALMSNFIGAFAFNFSIQGDRLISDVAIDPAVANTSESGKQIINAIENGDPIDVSTGFYLNVEDAEGFGSDGEPFTGVASGLFLDHVAFLPNEVGAKNKLEGVGLHTNSAIDVDGNKLDTDVAELSNNASTPAMQLPLAPNDFTWNESAALERIKVFTNSTDKPSTNFRKFFLNFDQSNVDSFDSYTNLFADIIDGVPHAIKAPIEALSTNANAQAYNKRFAANKDSVINKAWNIIKSIFSNKELSHDDIENKIHIKLNEGRGDNVRHLWPMEIFDTSFVYRDENDTMFRQSYAMDGDDIVFIGERIEVERVVEFKPVTNDNGDRIMRDKILKALNAAKVKTEGLDDDALFAAYNKLGADQASGGEDNPQETDLSKVLASVNSLTEKVDTLQTSVNANADDELNQLAEQVGNLKKGISIETAKTMSVNSLEEFLASNGVVAVNSHGSQHQQTNAQSDTYDEALPGTEDK